MGAAANCLYRRLWPSGAGSNLWRALIGSWVTPPSNGSIEIEQGGEKNITINHSCGGGNVVAAATATATKANDDDDDRGGGKSDGDGNGDGGDGGGVDDDDDNNDGDNDGDGSESNQQSTNEWRRM